MTRERVPFETLEGEDFPTVRQVSVFLENRLGQLLRLTQTLEETNVKILALSVVDAADYAVVRLLLNDTDVALAGLKKAGFAVSVTELLVVRLPPGKRGLLTIWSALLSSEINVGYSYSLLHGRVGSAVAIYADNVEIAIDTLMRHNFEILGESDLQKGA
jgi:hypothetical protein